MSEIKTTGSAIVLTDPTENQGIQISGAKLKRVLVQTIKIPSRVTTDNSSEEWVIATSSLQKSLSAGVPVEFTMDSLVKKNYEHSTILTEALFKSGGIQEEFAISDNIALAYQTVKELEVDMIGAPSKRDQLNGPDTQEIISGFTPDQQSPIIRLSDNQMEVVYTGKVDGSDEEFVVMNVLIKATEESGQNLQLTEQMTLSTANATTYETTQTNTETSTTSNTSSQSQPAEIDYSAILRGPVNLE